jgi:hypothetical protein
LVFEPANLLNRANFPDDQDDLDPFTNRQVRFPNVENGHVAYKASFGALPVLRHFVRDASGRPVFAGWEEAAGTSMALPEGYAAGRDAGLSGRDWNTNRVLHLGMPGGETAFKYGGAADKEGSIGDRFVSLIFSQLSMGPGSLGDEQILNALNIFLSRELPFDLGSFVGIDEWKSYLKEALRLAVRHTPAFDDGGARTAAAIREDAARLLRMDDALLAQWEQYFLSNVIDLQIKGDRDEFAVLSEERKILLGGMETHIAALAETELVIKVDAAASVKKEETGLHWDLALFSVLPTEDKIGMLREYLTALIIENKNALAGRALAIVLKHSALNSMPSLEDGIVQRWSAAEITGLFRLIMTGETWSLASHRSFRRYLTPEENRDINKIVAEANYQNSIAAVYGIDVTQSGDEFFWNAVDATGEADLIMDFALSKMAQAALN